MTLFIELIYELIMAKIRPNVSLQQALKFSNNSTKRADPVFLSHLDRSLHLISRMVPHFFSCLHQSIAIEKVVRKKGFNAKIQIAPIAGGVGGFMAHAWVDLGDGITVGTPVTQAPLFEKRSKPTT